VIVTPDGPFIVETHLRQAGDEIPHLVEDATGIDMLAIYVRQVAGFDVRALPELQARAEAPAYVAAASIRFLLPGGSGVLVGVRGLDAASGVPGVVEVSQLVEDGSGVGDVESSYSRLASVRAKTPTTAEALDAVERAVGMLSADIQGSAAADRPGQSAEA
jgi:hypothetical protein